MEDVIAPTPEAIARDVAYLTARIIDGIMRFHGACYILFDDALYEGSQGIVPGPGVPAVSVHPHHRDALTEALRCLGWAVEDAPHPNSVGELKAVRAAASGPENPAGE